MKHTIETQKTRAIKNPESLEAVKERLKVKNLVDEILRKYEVEKIQEENKKALVDYLKANGCDIIKNEGNEVIAKFKD